MFFVLILKLQNWRGLLLPSILAIVFGVFMQESCDKTCGCLVVYTMHKYFE